MSVDIQELKRNVSMVDVAESFGVETTEKNGRTYCLCPFHNDTNFGSCYIEPLSDFEIFHCWACGVHVDLIGLTQRLLGTENIAKVERYICERLGYDGFKRTDDSYSFLSLKAEEKRILDIRVNLSSFAKENPKRYKEIILNKAKVSKEKYEKILSEYCRRDAKYAYKLVSAFPDAVEKRIGYASLYNEVVYRIGICGQVIERFS